MPRRRACSQTDHNSAPDPNSPARTRRAISVLTSRYSVMTDDPRDRLPRRSPIAGQGKCEGAGRAAKPRASMKPPRPVTGW